MIVKGGEIIDPALGIHDKRDIGISQGKIIALEHDIAANEAKNIIDAKGKIVTPGLIDSHSHVADGIITIGVSPDECGVFSGVTTVCDAGSTGCANFMSFRKYVIPRAKTDIFCFLNLCSTGLTVIPEIWSWNTIDPEATIKVIEENRDIIKGIKLRATGALVKNLGSETVKTAKGIASEVNLPLMIHLGIDPEENVPENVVNSFTREMLSLLDQGDILTHIYTWKKGGVIGRDGGLLPGLKEAIQRGVILDVAYAKTHFSIEITRIGLEQGVLPTTVSTDLTAMNINDSVYSLPVTMSKLLALGFNMDQLITMTTINPAKMLKEEHHRGTLRAGMSADISILELAEGDFLFANGKIGQTFTGKSMIVPRLTLKSGVEIETKPRFD
ncbi:MAG: amidohydrolase/deacetylase family metallohydrolase [Deltaproteobacteria bacterium]|nr:amidohydrolase/deacetylase family metallohydrolase [Deltaproteobacteria bacterium]MBW2309445.1 amidohydrolase/deacetylase family metallohydrolase [Deltaproteobacteria bacterium]